MLRLIISNVLLIFAYLGSLQLVELLAATPAQLLPLRLEVGVAVSAVGLRGFHLCAGVFVAELVAWWLAGAPAGPLYGIGIAAGVTTATALLGWFARRYLRGPGDLSSGFSLLRSLLVLSPLAGVLMAALQWLAGDLPQLPGDSSWLRLGFAFSAAAFGVIAAMPVVFVLLERRAARRPARATILAGLLCTLLFVVFAAYVAERDRASRELQNDLREQVANSANRMENYLATYIVALRAVEALFASSGNVTREEFDTFSRSLQEPLPGLYATAWDAFVPDSERDAFVQRMRETGLPDFEIFEVVDGERRTAPRRPYTVPVAYARYEGEPLKALGFDMASEPTRKAALDQALRTGEPTASGRVKLVTDIDPGYDILILMTMRSAASQQLIGYSGLAVRVSELFDFALSGLDKRLLVRLYDRSASPESAWLHGAPEDLVPARGSLIETRAMEIAGRDWEFELIAPPSFVASYFPTQSMVLLWGGLALVLMLGVLLLDLGGRRGLGAASPPMPAG